MNDPSGKAEQLYPHHPEQMTPPGWAFQREYQRILSFVFYVTGLATQQDQIAKIAVTALYQDEEPEKCDQDLKRIDEFGALPTLRKYHRRMVLEMMLSRAAENFLEYIAEILALIFRTRPETLRSSETVRLDVVLKHANMDELIRELAERRVNQLTYQGMRDLAGYLSDRLGFDLFPTPDNLERAVRIVECRNIIVHNRGIVNDVFLSRIPNASEGIGQPLDLNFDQIGAHIAFLATCVYSADERAREKFKLPTTVRVVSDGGTAIR